MQVSLSYSIIDGKAFMPAYLEHAVVQFRTSSNAKFYGPYDVTLSRVLANANLRTPPEHAKMVDECLHALEAFFHALPKAASTAVEQPPPPSSQQGAAAGMPPASGAAPSAAGWASMQKPPQLKSAGSSLHPPPPVKQPVTGAAGPDSPPVSPNSKVARQTSFTF